MARSLWEGSISFGLVDIPVGLYPAEYASELSFKLLDERDLSPVGYHRINKNTGKEVPWDKIVRGYEYEKGEYVLVTDDELKAANPRATQTVEIIGFVDDGAIDVVYFDRPYYLAPGRRGGKSYALLRDTLQRTKQIGIAQVVIRTRQHLAALMVRGPVLVLELLRYDTELRKPEDLDLPVDLLQKTRAREAELKLAERLVTEMKTKWKPDEYHDTYRDDVLALIEMKVKSGNPRAVIAPPRKAGAKGEGKVVDLMALLKKSVGEAGARGARRANEPAAGRRAGEHAA
ncbi:MAG TPA: Ku protein, partial [Candidatus Eisenbacteria bacterium]|nr:Ku protein [Candidatus Eisenbacteria bacterium]